MPGESVHMVMDWSGHKLHGSKSAANHDVGLPMHLVRKFEPGARLGCSSRASFASLSIVFNLLLAWLSGLYFGIISRFLPWHCHLYRTQNVLSLCPDPQLKRVFFSVEFLQFNSNCYHASLRRLSMPRSGDGDSQY